MKNLLILLVIMTITPQIVLSQITDSTKDSLTISRDQVTQVANGLVNEGRLKTVYQQLKLEHTQLEQSYLISNNRNIRFKDTIIPTLESMIKSREIDIQTHTDFTSKLETSLKAQKKKKWKYGVIGAGVGIILSLLLSK